MEYKIYDLCIDMDIDDAEKILKENFKKVTYCDEKIDDGLDDGDYLIMRSYDVDKYYVRLYFTRSKRIITDVFVNKR